MISIWWFVVVLVELVIIFWLDCFWLFDRFFSILFCFWYNFSCLLFLKFWIFCFVVKCWFFRGSCSRKVVFFFVVFLMRIFLWCVLMIFLFNVNLILVFFIFWIWFFKLKNWLKICGSCFWGILGLVFLIIIIIFFFILFI